MMRCRMHGSVTTGWENFDPAAMLHGCAAFPKQMEVEPLSNRSWVQHSSWSIASVLYDGIQMSEAMAFTRSCKELLRHGQPRVGFANDIFGDGKTGAAVDSAYSLKEFRAMTITMPLRTTFCLYSSSTMFIFPPIRIQTSKRAQRRTAPIFPSSLTTMSRSLSCPAHRN